MKEKILQTGWIKWVVTFALALMLTGLWGNGVKAAIGVYSNGSTYTTVQKGTWPNVKTVIYRQKDGQSKKKLKTVTGSAYPCFEYKNVLYYEKDRKDDPTCIDLWSVNLKTLKVKKVFSNATARAYSGKYAVLMPNTGAVIPLPCHVYNLSTGKAKLLTSDCLSANIYNNKIYFAKATGSYVANKGWKVRIYRTNLSGSGKKAVSGYFYAMGVEKITSKSVIIYKGSNTYRYSFSTKKSTKIA